MIKQLFLVAIFSFAATVPTWSRLIIDMAGRKVDIPDNITKVAPYDNKTNVILYPIAREKMVVKARAKVSPDLKYISRDYLKLPEVDTRNAEEMLKLNPDFIVVGTFVADKTGLDEYLRFSERTNIPVVFVDLELLHLDKSFLFLGDLFGCRQHAEEYANFIKQVYQNIWQVSQDAIRPNAYLANENNGLRTAPKGSSHAQIFDIMQVDNVAKANINSQGFALTSIEQVMMWNPSYIFCLGKAEGSPYRTILKSALWKNIDAVKNQRVYYVPSEPFPWLDMPPSVNRIPGLIWFMEIFYHLDKDRTKEDIKTFYRLFYAYELNDKEYEQLFKWQ